MSEDAILDDLVEDAISRVNGVTDIVDDGRPLMTSPDWSDWVLSLLTDDEVISIDGKDCPRVHGLRRIAKVVLEPVYGRIVCSLPVNPQDTSREGMVSAASSWIIRFENGMEFGDVASVSQYNTDDQFLPYALETSATRAEGRALRKALCINRVSAEEMTRKDTSETAKEAKRQAKYETTTSGDSDSGKEKSSPEWTKKQIGFLKSLCRELDMNVDAALTLVGVSDKSQLNKDSASRLLDKLVELRSSGEVPGDMQPYEEWSI